MATWFEYDVCTDIPQTRWFYGELLGLIQTWDEPDDVAFIHDSVQLSFTRVDVLERPSGWSFQPGWSHGQLSDAPPAQRLPSRSIAMQPEEFSEAVTRLLEAGVERLRDAPFWVGYWSFVVRDPDGRTVEISDPQTTGPEESGQENPCRASGPMSSRSS